MEAMNAGKGGMENLDTPYVLIDLEKVERNINRLQRIAERNGVGVRPHSKTHKLPEIARMQLGAGAIGQTAAKLGEAEAMADAGVRDILVAYPIVGVQKLQRLVQLAQRAEVTVAVDSLAVAAGISRAASEVAGLTIGLAIEIDCGFRRVGVASIEAAVELGERIRPLPGVRLRGITTFAGHSYDARAEEIRRVAEHEGRMAVEAAEALRRIGFAIDIVSAGSTPSSPYTAEVAGITEVRPGAYVFGDLMQVEIGAHRLDDCALSVLCTVVSRPEPHRAVIDAGTKVLTSDGGDSPIGTGRGYVIGHPGIEVAWLTEEHGMLTLPPEEQGLAVGDMIAVIPVHACGVINTVDEVAAIRDGEVEAIWKVTARGKSR